MFDFLLGNTLWQLIAQSDVVTKAVLFILLGMSVVCWALFFYKCIVLRVKRKHATAALHMMRRAESVDDLIKMGQLLSGTVPGYFIARIMRATSTLLALH